jgi:hypothetical protein
MKTFATEQAQSLATEPFPRLRGKVPKADGGSPAPMMFPFWPCIECAAVEQAQSLDALWLDHFHGSGFALTPTLSRKRERGLFHARGNPTGDFLKGKPAAESFPRLRGRSLPRTGHGVPKADGGRSAPAVFPLRHCIECSAAEQIQALDASRLGYSRGSGAALTPTLSRKRERGLFHARGNPTGRLSTGKHAAESFPRLRGKSLPRTGYRVLPKADGDEGRR